MKKRILSGIAAALLAVASARAGLYTESFDGIDLAIPDGNPVGVVLNGNVGDIPAGDDVNGLTMSVSLSGGYDANLYAYLVAPNGTMVVLLDHPGVTTGNPFGNPGPGMNITFADGSPAITASSDLSSGTYAAAGSLADFNGAPATGTWELFFADTVNGGGTSTINGWSMEISAVPEPVNVGLAVFGGLTVLIGLLRWRKSRQRV